MDEILAKAGSQAVTFAIRSGISLASGYAIKTVVKFMEKVPKDERKRIEALNEEIQTKFAIISNAMDLIRLAAARGNTMLSPTLKLITSIEREIETMDQTINLINSEYTSSNEKQAVDSVLASMRTLIAKIEQSIPFLQISILTSGIEASGALPSLVSPGRLLQASNFVSKTINTSTKVPIGPQFDCILYSIFYNPSRLKYVDEAQTSAISWKEDFARATVQIYQTSEHRYELQVAENFNDGRYHDDEEAKERKHTIAILSIARLFFSASGKLLKLEGNSSPVLILKLLKDAGESWLAFGETGQMFDEEDDDDDEDEDDPQEAEASANNKELPTESSLSLLEYIIRLLSLQTNNRTSIFDATDETLALYLKDENYILNTQYLKTAQSTKNEESLTLDSNVKRLENFHLKADS